MNHAPAKVGNTEYLSYLILHFTVRNDHGIAMTSANFQDNPNDDPVSIDMAQAMVEGLSARSHYYCG
jgi:hypothetical protein